MGNVCPFMSGVEYRKTCVTQCKFYDENYKSNCLIYEGMKDLPETLRRHQDIQNDNDKVKD